MEIKRSQLLLDIEHDLSRIKNRLNALEDHFEDDGVIARIDETLRSLVYEVERIRARRELGDDVRH